MDPTSSRLIKALASKLAPTRTGLPEKLQHTEMNL
jgi:hypothetical protein